MAERGRIRWYNPKLGGFEWRELLASDGEALSLLDGYPGAEARVLRSTKRSRGSNPVVFRIWAGARDLELRFGDVEKRRDSGSILPV